MGQACGRMGELEAQSSTSHGPLIPARHWVGRDKIKTTGQGELAKGVWGKAVLPPVVGGVRC